LDSLSKALGSSLVGLEALTDAAHCLRAREREFLKNELDGFQQAFPQVFLGVYLGVLPSAPSHGEIAFWLLNHAAFQPCDPSRLNERAVLLLIDPVAKAAGLTVGYGLEPFLPQRKLQAMLRKIRTPLWHGEYTTAITQAVGLLGVQLRKYARRMSRQVEFPPPGAEADFIQASGLQSLRPSNGPANQRRQGARPNDLAAP
jgi:hypothetical protein